MERKIHSSFKIANLSFLGVSQASPGPGTPPHGRALGSGHSWVSRFLEQLGQTSSAEQLRNETQVN